MIQLSNKTKVDLAKRLGPGTARDFRILNLKEVLEHQGGDSNVSVVVSSQGSVGGAEMEVDGAEEEESDEETPSKRARVSQ